VECYSSSASVCCHMYIWITESSYKHEMYPSSITHMLVCTSLQASFPAYVLAELQKAGFPAPTPIQAQVGHRCYMSSGTHVV
jgi:superfamily II DNA/RNA helicase